MNDQQRLTVIVKQWQESVMWWNNRLYMWAGQVVFSAAFFGFVLHNKYPILCLPFAGLLAMIFFNALPQWKRARDFALKCLWKAEQKLEDSKEAD